MRCTKLVCIIRNLGGSWYINIYFRFIHLFIYLHNYKM